MESIITETLLNDYKNVETYGIIGDGKTDNSEKIKYLLEHLEDGDIVYFPKGTYICKENIIIPNEKIKIYGAGRDLSIIDLGNGSIEFKGNYIELNNLQFTKGKYVKLNGYHSTISSCRVNYCETGLHLVNGYITQILNSYITYNKIGVYYDNQSYESIIDNSVIDNNEIGVIYGGTSSGARISNSTVEGNRNLDTKIGCGIVISNISTDIKIDKCWFEDNGMTDSSADIFFNCDIHKPMLNDLFNHIKELCPDLLPYECCGSVVIEDSHFLFTKHSIAISGERTEIYIKGNSFKARIDTYTKPVDIYTKKLTSSNITCLCNCTINTNNSEIDKQILTGVKSSYIHTDLVPEENEIESLITGTILLDGKPLFLYEGNISDLSKVKNITQYQVGNESNYISAFFNEKSVNSYKTKTATIYLSDNKTDEGNIFETTGDKEFIVLATPNSEFNYQFGENQARLVKAIKHNIFPINRSYVNVVQAYAQNKKQIFFALIILSEEEKLKMKQCVAFKPLDVHYSIVNNGEI